MDSVAGSGESKPERFISVCVPTAPGRERLLHNSLSRLLFQERRNFEVVVVSDGPMRNLADICNCFSESFPMVVEETVERTRGFGHEQTSIAIEKSSGDWFVRVNDDNVIYPMFTREIENAGVDVLSDILIWKVYFADEGAHHGMVLPVVLPPEPGGIDMLNFSVRLPLARAVGFPFRSHAADWEFLRSCLLERDGDYTFIPKVLGEHW